MSFHQFCSEMRWQRTTTPLERCVKIQDRLMKQQLPSHFMKLGRCGGGGKQKIAWQGVRASQAFSVGPEGHPLLQTLAVVL